MRIFLWLLCFVLLAIVGFGVHFVLEQQRQVTSFSAKTTAIVLGKRLEQKVHYGTDTSITYEPIVTFRYEAQGQQFTSDNVFPDTFRVGGNIGYLAAKAPLDEFQIGEETTAYYNPEIPAEACLIRRPSFSLYLVILLPIIAVSGLVAFLWRPSQRGDSEIKRRKGRWIAALWHIVGLASGGHYFTLAGADYGGGALLMFAVYTQLGLIPLAYALPPSKSSEIARRLKTAIGLSVFGTFISIFLGWAVGWLATRFFSASSTGFLQSWRYTMAITAALFALLGLLSTSPRHGKRGSGKSKRTEASRRHRPRRYDRRRNDEFVPMPPPDCPIPYHIDQRPMPSGEYLETLLPVQVGPFRRETIEEPDDVRNAPIYAEYRSDGGEIFVELGVCGDPASAQMAVETSKAETDAEFPDAAQRLSLKTEPSFFKTKTRLGAFMSWTRGGYYFSAHAKGGEEDLDRFMEAFPY